MARRTLTLLVSCPGQNISAFSLELTGIAVRGHSGLAGITIDLCGMQACPRERNWPLERGDTAGLILRLKDSGCLPAMSPTR